MPLPPKVALPLSPNIMDNLDFSEEEIQEQLEILGYKNIPKHRLREFKRDLDELIRHEKSRSQASSSELLSPKSQTANSQQSPPAYIKEKVNQYYIRGPANGHLLYAVKPECERQVLTSCHNRDNGTRQDHYDSYARHSVAPKHPRHLGPTGLEVEPERTDTQNLLYAVSETTSPDAGVHGRHFIKRKVLRKHKGQVLVCDESVHSEDSDAVSGLEERLGGLHVSMSVQQDSEPENEDISSQSDRRSSEDDGLSPSAFETYTRGMTQTQSEKELRPRPKSFIRPLLDHPHTRNLKKCDPVSRYFQYKQDWEMFKIPGEKDRKALHWEIREQLAYHPLPPKPRRVYVPNTYVVPTDKKRSALRWEIRNDLANGLQPRLNYRF